MFACFDATALLESATTVKRHFHFLFVTALAVAGWALVILQSRQSTRVPRVVTRFVESPATPPSPPGAFSLAMPGLEGASVGFCLLNSDGTPLHESPRSRIALAPASALKAVTTATALEFLGPDFRFRTSLLAAASAPDAAGSLAGPLVLTGSGDPTLTAADLRAMAGKIASMGVKSVTGGVLADASVFPHDPTSEHWNWGDIGNAYGTGAYGLNLDRNVMTVRIAPGAEEGAPTTLTGHAPTLPDLVWHNHTLTGPPGSGDGVVVYSEPYGRRITLRGTVPPGPEFTVRAAFPDPPALAAATLREALGNLGIRMEDSPAAAVDASHELLVHESAPLPEIIAHCHRVSDNLEAQCLFLTLGKSTGLVPAAAIQSHWLSRGATPVAWRLIDGSGLARANCIRPLDLARILHLASQSPHGPLFLETLSPSHDGRVRSKLGAMSGVRSDAGFIRMPDGSQLTFALIANSLTPQADFRELRHRLLTEALALP